MSAVVFMDRLEPADSKRDALIGLLREFAESINGSSHLPRAPTPARSGTP
jgi:hypothetical protein